MSCCITLIDRKWRVQFIRRHAKIIDNSFKGDKEELENFNYRTIADSVSIVLNMLVEEEEELEKRQQVEDKHPNRHFKEIVAMEKVEAEKNLQ